MEFLVDQLVLFIFICLFIVLYFINAYFYSLPKNVFQGRPGVVGRKGDKGDASGPPVSYFFLLLPLCFNFFYLIIYNNLPVFKGPPGPPGSPGPPGRVIGLNGVSLILLADLQHIEIKLSTTVWFILKCAIFTKVMK